MSYDWDQYLKFGERESSAPLRFGPEASSANRAAACTAELHFGKLAAPKM